ncbi:nitroreductase family protein [Enterococcus nangangensis]|uniref:nitroreductase family protein n=1 Tax=Enterococcus nangangensis TaxID=2559926 RepID=UPI0010F7520B|nr:nitroreductase family protein [Enterococcus nangangensis]
MDLFDAISQRKACREYLDEPFSASELAEVETTIKNFEPLFPNVSLDYRFATKTKGIFQVKAPQYLIISGSGQEGEQENAGFIGEQFILWLNTRGLGATWLGASKDASENRKKKDLIVIAFGKVEGSPHRQLSEFKRKELAEITNAPEDKGIQAMHLAPSGINLQPWYFEKKWIKS